MKLSDEQASSSITANSIFFFFFRESFITDEFIRALLWNILSKGSNEEIKRISPSLSKYYRFDIVSYIDINIPLETTIISMMLAKYRKFRNEATKEKIKFTREMDSRKSHSLLLPQFPDIIPPDFCL